MKVKKNVRQELVLVVVILMLGVVFSILSNSFLSANNIIGILRKSTELMLLTFGMAGAIIAGGTDLSIGALCSLDTVLIAFFHVNAGLPVFLALVVACILSLLIGVINGVVIGCLKVAPMLATLGMQAVLLGLGLVITSGSVISGFPDWYIAFGNSRAFGIIPYQLFLLIPIAVFMYLLYSRTRLGRQIYLVGTNAQVAEFSNISVKWTIIKVYMLSALMAFFASVVLSSRLASGRPDIATSYLMPAIGAAVVGGVSMQGGKGSILGCALGVILFMVISNGLLQFIPQNATFYESVVTGAMILGILSYRSWRDRK